VTNWASATNQLLYLEYQTYNQEDFSNFMLNYNYMTYLYEYDDYYDFDKVNIDTGGAKHRVISPSPQSFWTKNTTNSFQILVNVKFGEELWTIAGAPRDVWYNITVEGEQISVELLVLGKEPTRLPEAMFLRFTPQFSPHSSLTWSMDKLYEDTDPLDVTVGGSKKMHSVSSHVSASASGHTLRLEPHYSPLVCFGEPSGFPVPTDKTPDISKGSSVILWDNIWNTNYPLWYPFNPSEDNLKFRFSLRIN